MAEGGAEDIHRLLAELPEADLRATFIEMLKSDVGEILRVSPEKIDATRSLYDIGLGLADGRGAGDRRRGALRRPPAGDGAGRHARRSRAWPSASSRCCARPRTRHPPTDSTTVAEVTQVVQQHEADVTPETIARFAEELEASARDGAKKMIH